MAKGGFPRNMGMGGMGNMNNMIKQAQKMQEEMMKAQEALQAQEFEASVGGGAVSVKASGSKEILEIKISPDALDPDDGGRALGDMVQDGIAQINEAVKARTGLDANALVRLESDFGFSARKKEHDPLEDIINLPITNIE